MANTQLFKSTRGKLPPEADTLNEAGGKAYSLPAKARLAQYLMTGCLNGTFYADAETQLDEILALAEEVEPDYLARAAVYARIKGHMKDTPALITAILTRKDGALAKKVFERVIDNGKMLRNFVQILRSGMTGRKSLGTAPKKMVQRWLAQASDRQLLNASVGQSPSLADVIKMVHPNPADERREIFYAWLIGKKVDETKLPEIVQAFERFKRCEGDVPDIDFRLLTGQPLTKEQWKAIARQAPWQMTRMNLNTFARQNVFDTNTETMREAFTKVGIVNVPDDMVEIVANRLQDIRAIRQARAYPYQLLAAWNAGKSLPPAIRNALQAALEVAVDNVPVIEGSVVVLLDVSGSMDSPVTGFRQGASSKVTCIDAASLIAVAVLRKNPLARVIAFNERAWSVDLNPRDALVTNSGKLTAMMRGGTAIASGFEFLNHEQAKADFVLLVSDNQSWADTANRGTATMQAWEALRARNPGARLACVDMQPYGTVQAVPGPDVLHVGGFSDAVFDVLASFASGQMDSNFWVKEIEQTEI